MSPVRVEPAVPAGPMPCARRVVAPVGWLPALATVSAVALLAHAALLFGGKLFEGVDTRTHFQWAWQFADGLRQGDLKPMWSHLANEGLGQPVFIVGQVLYLYIVSALHLAGLDLWLSMRVVLAASTLAVGVVAVAALRRQYPARVTIAVAVVLQCLPFIAFLLGFHAGLTAHFSTPLALTVLALSLLHPRLAIDVRLALAVALLCVSHVLVAFMTLLCLTLHFGVRALSREGLAAVWREARWWGLSVGLGLGAASAFLLLALTSMGYMQGLLNPNDRYLDWRNSFLFPLITSQIHGMRWAAIQWVLPLPSLVTLCAGALLMWKLREPWPGSTRRQASALLWVGALALLLGTEWSFPLYQSIGVLRSVQWPYRFLGVASLATALALAPLAVAACADPRRWPQALVFAAGASSLAMFAFVAIKQHIQTSDPGFGSVKVLEGRFAQKGADPVTAGPRWEEYLARGSLAGECARLGLVCRTVQRSSHLHVWEMHAPAPARVVLPLFSFPAWSVQVGGVLVAQVADDPTGLIEVDLPAGTSRVEVRWRPMWQERIGGVLSILSLAVLGGLAAWRWRASRRG